MHMISLFILGFLIIPQGFSQEASVPTSLYYERKADLFRYLPNGPDEIIMLGNSITDGGNWSELLPDPRIINRGISADVTRGILNRADEILESKPLKIFLLIGINDLAKGASQENILENIGAFVREVKKQSPRTQTYIQSILPVNPKFESYPKHVSKGQGIVEINKKIALLCQDMDVEYLNLYPHFTAQGGVLNPQYTNDGLHLSGRGYIVWSEILKPYLVD